MTATHLFDSVARLGNRFCPPRARYQPDWIPANASFRVPSPHTASAHMSDEKITPSSSSASDIPLNSQSHSTQSPAHSFVPARLPPRSSSCSRSHRYVRPRGLRIWNLFKKWSPVLAYAATSLGFLVAIAFWKNQVFDGE